jgi:hypothetical protein
MVKEAEWEPTGCVWWKKVIKKEKKIKRIWYTAASWLTSSSVCPEWGRGRDTTCHLGDRPPTVPPPPHLWGWGCPVQEPGITGGIRPSTSVVNLRMTGQCHSSGQSVQKPSDPATLGWKSGSDWAYTRLCSRLGWDEPSTYLETYPIPIDIMSN